MHKIRFYSDIYIYATVKGLSAWNPFECVGQRQIEQKWLCCGRRSCKESGNISIRINLSIVCLCVSLSQPPLDATISILKKKLPSRTAAFQHWQLIDNCGQTHQRLPWFYTTLTDPSWALVIVQSVIYCSIDAKWQSRTNFFHPCSLISIFLTRVSDTTNTQRFFFLYQWGRTVNSQLFFCTHNLNRPARLATTIWRLPIEILW